MQTQTERESKPETDEVKIPAANGTFTFPSSVEFKSILKFLSELASETITFELDNEGLNVSQMDPSRVSLAVLKLPKHGFEEFLCVQAGRFTLNIQDTLDHVLKRVKKDETVKIDVTDDRAIFLLKHRLERVFRQPLKDGDEYEKVPDPKVRHTARMKLVTQSVKEIGEDLREFCDMTVEQDRITFSEPEDDYGIDFSVTLEKGSDSLLDIELREQPFKSRYSANYLGEFAKYVSKLCDILTLELAKDMPLKFSCHIFNVGELEYWLAPRIESD